MESREQTASEEISGSDDDGDFVSIDNGGVDILTQTIESEDGNKIFRSYFQDDLIETDDTIIATKNLDLSRFRSFSTDGRKSFEEAIILHDTQNVPLSRGQTKEELLNFHLIRELIELVAYYKTIADCSTSSFIMDKLRQTMGQDSQYQSKLVDMDLSQMSHLDLFRGTIQMDDRRLSGFDFHLNIDEPSVSGDNKAPSLDSDQGSTNHPNPEPNTKPKRARKRKLSEMEATNSVPIVQPTKKKRKPRLTNEKTRDALAQARSKRFWLDDIAKGTCRFYVRIGKYVSFEKFRQQMFFDYQSELVLNFAKVMDEFLLTTLYELLFSSRHCTTFDESNVAFILSHISRAPPKKIRKKKQPISTTNQEDTLMNTEQKDINQEEDNQLPPLDIGVLEYEFRLLLTKVRGHFSQLDPTLPMDSFLQNQSAIIQKYAGLIDFTKSAKDGDFNRCFEMGSIYDIGDEITAKALLRWKEFLKMAMNYSFIQNEVNNVPIGKSAVDDMLLRTEDDNERSHEIVQILDNSTVELVPTMDCVQCFQRPVKFAVNMDGRCRKGKSKKDNSSIGYLIPESENETKDGSVETVRLYYKDSRKNAKNQQEDDIGLGDVVIKGTILYDTQSFYVMASGILDTLVVDGQKVAPWVLEYLAVDVFDLWQTHVKQNKE